MRESISSNRKVYLVERSNNELINHPSEGGLRFILTLTGQWINSCQYINNVSENPNYALFQEAYRLS